CGVVPPDPPEPSLDPPVLDPKKPDRRANGSLAEQIANRLRRAILDGEFEPGERIRQEPIAARLGVSRSPVREALPVLAGDGLVTQRPDVGARVARLDLRELVEISLTREPLEPLALQAGARHLQRPRLDALAARLDRLDDQATPPVDTDQWHEMDR